VGPAGRDAFLSGKPIGDSPPGSREAPAAVSIFRPVLSELLSKQARRHGARLRYSVSVKTLVQIDDGVVAEFTDGTQGRYDLVVGADGIRSEVRRLAIADDIQPHHARQTSVRWMAKGPPIDGPHMLYCAPTITLLSIPLPLQNFIYVATVSNGCLTEHVDSDKARAILAEQLAAFTAPYVVELAKRLTPASDVVVRPFEWLLVPYPWFRGRVLLIGDAAHATTPYLAAGGGMAMEDAVVLAECLATAASVKVGLEAFMKRRFERVRQVVDSSAAISKLEQEGASPSTIYARRNAAIRQLAEPY